MMEAAKIFSSLLAAVFMAMVSSSMAYDYYVGGKDGWVQNPSENYNSWAGRNRFQINDKLVFHYEKGEDSVLVVSKEAYDSCNVTNPIKKLDGGDSVFVFDRSGPFFFISGAPGRCQMGQKLIVVVLAVRNKKGSPPAISPPLLTPPSPSPSSSPVSSPSPSPSASHAPSHSPISPPSSSVSPPSYSPINSPAPSPSHHLSPHAPSPSYTPISSPSPAPTPPPSHSQTPTSAPSPSYTPISSPSHPPHSHTPTSAPSPSPKPGTVPRAPPPAAVEVPTSQPPSSEAGPETGFGPASSPRSPSFASPVPTVSMVSVALIAMVLSGVFLV